MFCPKCGKEIADDAVFCQNCGANLKEDASTVISGGSKGINIQKKYIIIGLAIILVIVVVYGYINTLHGDDKIVYEMVYEAADSFKDPTSVRIQGGTLSDSKKYLWCKISAVNGFGARGSDYYTITRSDSGSVYVISKDEEKTLLGDDYSDVLDTTSLYIATDSGLHFDKINKELEKNLK